MRRLYFVSHRITNALTGGEFCSRLLLESAAETGMQVECWEGDRYGPLKKSIVIMNCIFLFRAIFMKSDSFLLLDMDFHARYLLAVLWARMVKKAKTIGLLYHYTYWDKYSSLSRSVHYAIEQWVSRRCDFLITISRFSADNFSLLAKKDLPIFMIEPFSKDDLFLPAEKACFDPACQKLLFVGSVERRKNVITIIRALSLLTTPFSFDIVGFFPSRAYRDAVMAAIRSAGLENRVIIHGQISQQDLMRKYASSTAFILVSHMEGYGMVYAEAMGFGLPVIAATRGAVPEIVENGINGFLCEPDDVRQIADAITRLGDRDTWERLSRNNLRKAQGFRTRTDFKDRGREIFRKIQSF